MIRISVVVIGILATALAIVVNSVYDLWYLCSDLVYVMLFPQLLCVVYFSWTNTYGSIGGYALGLFFRISGGERALNIPPFIRYPWYNETDGQLFPFKTTSMVITLVTLILVSVFTNYLFKNGILPKYWDVCRCVVNIPEGSTVPVLRPIRSNSMSLQTKTDVRKHHHDTVRYNPGYSSGENLDKSSSAGDQNSTFQSVRL